MHVLNSTQNRTENLSEMIYLMYDMTRDYMLITSCYEQAVNNIYHSTLFRCSLLVLVADQGRPVRKSIDYLLKVILRWQRVFIDPFFSSLIIDAFY